jgi:hypothetical protein
VDLIELAGRFGLPIAMLLLALWGGHRGYWTWSREVTQTRASCDELLKMARERREEAEKDRDYYRTALFEKMDRIESQALDVTGRAVTAAANKRGRA